jgi:predicted transcriptional regulator
MWHLVDMVLTDVSEERIASIFRVEGKIRKSASEETVRTGASTLKYCLRFQINYFKEHVPSYFRQKVG